MLTAAKGSFARLMRSASEYLGNHLKEKCYLKPYQQLPFKYFLKSFLIRKFVKSGIDPDDTN